METAFVNQRPLDTIPVRMLVGYLLSPRSLKHSDFAQIVRNWAEAVGPERTRVLFYDQLVADPADFLRDFARFTYGGDAAPILAKIDAAARAGGFRSRVFPGDDAPPSRPVQRWPPPHAKPGWLLRTHTFRVRRHDASSSSAASPPTRPLLRPVRSCPTLRFSG